MLFFFETWNTQLVCQDYLKDVLVDSAIYLVQYGPTLRVRVPCVNQGKPRVTQIVIVFVSCLVHCRSCIWRTATRCSCQTTSSSSLRRTTSATPHPPQSPDRCVYLKFLMLTLIFLCLSKFPMFTSSFQCLPLVSIIYDNDIFS